MTGTYVSLCVWVHVCMYVRTYVRISRLFHSHEFSSFPFTALNLHNIEPYIPI